MDTFQQQALHFDMPTHNFDPNQVPEDGEQYLQRVVYERSNCPLVVRKPLKNATKRKNDDEKNKTTNEPKNIKSIWDQFNQVFPNIVHICQIAIVR